METLLSLTSKRAGDWFKEELRLLGGLDHIVDKGESVWFVGVGWFVCLLGGIWDGFIMFTFLWENRFNFIINPVHVPILAFSANQIPLFPGLWVPHRSTILDPDLIKSSSIRNDPWG